MSSWPVPLPQTQGEPLIQLGIQVPSQRNCPFTQSLLVSDSGGAIIWQMQGPQQNNNS